ncbi:hypothetical protein CP_0856 [Chlamydia pneumoniae AR39]|uniref:Uncharacterized protein n=1 Tax=Chlamydia pneumoniae TaxID=83558 RepID=Q9K1W7_CHLPN|nr:hypothetical protein CP_0856 [Chlamydia pneumoniae AR39]
MITSNSNLIQLRQKKNLGGFPRFFSDQNAS